MSFHHDDFIEKVTQDMQPLFKKAIGNIDENFISDMLNGKNLSLSNLSLEQTYVHNVFVCINRLMTSIKILDQSVIFIRSFPKRYKQQKITQNDWLQYHYTHFISIVVGVNDIALILTNIVFLLGLPERRCTSQIITENTWIQAEDDVLNALKALENSVLPFREPRNLYLHRGEQPDAEFVLLGIFHAVAEKFDKGKKDVERGYNHIIKEKVEKLQQNINEVKVNLKTLFSALSPVYERNKKILRCLNKQSSIIIV